MAAGSPDAPGTRGRGRPPGPSAAVRDAVFRAVRDELVEHGDAGFRIERVAERANVHKATVYRHWPTRTALVRAATADWQSTRVDLPDTGSWPGDVRAFCDVFADLQRAEYTRALLRTIVSANVGDRELRDELHDTWRRVAAPLREPVLRARRRGEVAPDCDPDLVIEMIAGPMVHRTVVTDTPLDRAFVDAVAEFVIAATWRGPTGR
ncbi:TetR/AcrR family transcriptional regulator [Yinghuangia seranimata]|uniref:TetR/AcrR family transcriptional regulator n=1 Tax=Yinghuangia seranimata TaxID=408067 RepID=UPI00248CCAF8|nr:TetR/AcrR family transcriptional regulator [Yinghuangia seranimata]MDI2130104.1 TetR/AcrR family transcriptional regulator [Yinghuangia seranimata]